MRVLAIVCLFVYFVTVFAGGDGEAASDVDRGSPEGGGGVDDGEMDEIMNMMDEMMGEMEGDGDEDEDMEDMEELMENMMNMKDEDDDDDDDLIEMIMMLMMDENDDEDEKDFTDFMKMLKGGSDRDDRDGDGPRRFTGPSRRGPPRMPWGLGRPGRDGIDGGRRQGMGMGFGSRRGGERDNARESRSKGFLSMIFRNRMNDDDEGMGRRGYGRDAGFSSRRRPFGEDRSGHGGDDNEDENPLKRFFITMMRRRMQRASASGPMNRGRPGPGDFLRGAGNERDRSYSNRRGLFGSGRRGYGDDNRDENPMRRLFMMLMGRGMQRSGNLMSRRRPEPGRFMRAGDARRRPLMKRMMMIRFLMEMMRRRRGNCNNGRGAGGLENRLQNWMKTRGGPMRMRIMMGSRGEREMETPPRLPMLGAGPPMRGDRRGPMGGKNEQRSGNKDNSDKDDGVRKTSMGGEDKPKGPRYERAEEKKMEKDDKKMEQMKRILKKLMGDGDDKGKMSNDDKEAMKKMMQKMVKLMMKQAGDQDADATSTETTTMKTSTAAAATEKAADKEMEG